MIPLKIDASIVAAKLVPEPNGVQLLKDWLEANDGKDVELIIRAPQEDKTKQQLGYLWGHVIPQIAERTGYSKDEVYGMLKYKLLRRQIDYHESEPVYIVRSLSELNKEEVSKFIEDSVAWGLYLGADIYPAQNYGGTQ